MLMAPCTANGLFLLIMSVATFRSCCGAGTAADTENVTGLIASQLDLHRLQTSRDVRRVPNEDSRSCLITVLNITLCQLISCLVLF